MNKKLLILAVGLLLAGCKNTTDPMLTEHVCQQTHSETHLMMIPMTNCNGKTCSTHMMLMPVTNVICDKGYYITYPNPDYRGD
jgi:hypothetical protein